MFRTYLRRHLKQNAGDLYIQMLICFILFAMLMFFILQITASMTQKLWIDDKLDDISKLVASNGSTSTAQIQEIENEIIDNVGGKIVYDCTYFNETEKTVQLGEIVKIQYTNDNFPLIKIGTHAISISVNIDRRAISEVYYKPEP